jgi:hypothetical protein
MGLIVRISAKDKPEKIRRELDKLTATRAKKKKTFASYYGSLPTTYGDGLAYQKKQRDEWK